MPVLLGNMSVRGHFYVSIYTVMRKKYVIKAKWKSEKAKPLIFLVFSRVTEYTSRFSYYV